MEDVFRLPYDDESFGLLLVSTPQMFELSFIPYIKQYGWDSSRDPLDQSVQHRISKAISVSPIYFLDLQGIWPSCSANFQILEFILDRWS